MASKLVQMLTEHKRMSIKPTLRIFNASTTFLLSSVVMLNRSLPIKRVQSTA